MKARGVSVAAIVILASALAGGLMGTRAGAQDAKTVDRINERYGIYVSALAAIQRDYVQPLDDATSAQVVYRSIDALLRTLDPHSSFLEPREYERMREQQGGTYVGIGITIVSLDGVITVTQLFEESPAYRAGVG